MAKQKVTIVTTTRKRKTSSNNDDTMICNVCNGTGRQKKPSRKK